VEIHVLGPLHVCRAGTPVAINAPKQRALLLRLLVAPGQVVPTERLIDDLWQGAAPPGALSSLRAYISNLRRALSNGSGDGDTILVTRATGYALEIDPEVVDAHRFEASLGSARRALAAGAPQRALDELDTALALWRGPALVDVADADFAHPTITRLDELHRIAHEERFDALLAAGEHGAAIADLERFIATEPLRERPRRQLALALHRAGRTADALQVHRTFRATLADELGLDPSEEFDDLAERLLRRDPSLGGPRQAPAARAVTTPGEVARPAAPSSPPVADPAGSSSPVLGRESERALITGAVARLRQGQGSLLLFGGEAGIGKSTLLEEVARQASPHVTVHWGRCPETDGAPAFWPWTRLLRSVVAEVDDHRLAAVAADVPAVAHLAPDLTRRTGVTPPLTGDDLHAARFELYDATTTLLRRLAADGGLVLLLDDLHWADAPSLELLGFLTGHLRDSPVLVAATYRDTPADRPAALDATLAAAVRDPATTDVHLAGLAEAEVAAVVAATLGRPPEEELVDDLLRRTDGNPFFVTQLARLVDGSAAGAQGGTIPTGIRHVIARRLQQLPPETQQLLELAAVVGRRFDAAVVAAAGDVPLTAVLDAMDAAYEHGLVEPDGGSARRFRFVHALVRETLHDGLSPATTARSHAAVGAVLEALGTVGAQELAEHYWLAADLAPEGSALRWAVAAADEALELLAYERAEAHLRRALELLDATSADLDSEVAVRVRLVSLLTSVAGWSDPDIGEVAGRVHQLAATHGLRPELLPLWHLLWTCQTTRGDLAGGLELAKELAAQAQREGDSLHLAMATSMWGYNELHLGGDGPRNLARIRTARDALDREPAEYLAATPEHLGVTVRLAETVAAALVEGRDAGLAAAGETLAYARPLGRAFPEVAAYLFAAWAAGVVDAPEDAGRWTAEGLALCEHYGFRLAAHLLTPLDGWAAVHGGSDPATEAVRVGRSLDALLEAGHLHSYPHWAVLCADLLVRAGRLGEAAARLVEAREVVARTGERVQERHIAAVEARLERARSAGGRLAPQAAT
jgi:DNA-binding SARP family transcriptional activator